MQLLDPANVFKDPVPDSVPGYAEAIKDPIDFSTIRRRLQQGIYGKITDIESDVRLLCENAMVFNAPGTIYYKAATFVKYCDEME